MRYESKAEKAVKYFPLILCILLLLTALCGCSKDKTNTMVDIPFEDISDVENFVCYYSTNNELGIKIENEKAKELYSYVISQSKDAIRTQKREYSEKYIYLLFEEGGPILDDNQETDMDSSVVYVAPQCFGVYCIYENDYMYYSSSPLKSYAEDYKLPKGTYKKISEMLNKNIVPNY